MQSLSTNVYFQFNYLQLNGKHRQINIVLSEDEYVSAVKQAVDAIEKAPQLTTVLLNGNSEAAIMTGEGQSGEIHAKVAFNPSGDLSAFIQVEYDISNSNERIRLTSSSYNLSSKVWVGTSFPFEVGHELGRLARLRKSFKVSSYLCQGN